MPVDKQPVQIDFTQGVDSSSEARLVVPGKLTQLVNGVFTVGGTITKRHGYEDLGLSIAGGGSISSPRGLATYRDELLTVANNTLYSYSTGLSKHIPKGQLPGYVLSRLTGAGDDFLISDAAVLNNILMLVGYGSRYRGLWAHAYDLSSGQFTLFDSGLASTSAYPHAVATSSKLVAVVTTPAVNGLRLHVLDPASPADFSLLFLVPVTPSDYGSDACQSSANPAHLLVAFVVAGPQVRVVRVDTAGAIQADSGAIATMVPSLASTTVRVFDNGTNVYVTCGTTAVGGRIIVLDRTTLAVVAAATTYEALGGTYVGFLGTGSSVNLYYSPSAGGGVYKRNVTNAGVLGGITTILPDRNITGSPFVRGSKTLIPVGSYLVNASTSAIEAYITAGQALSGPAQLRRTPSYGTKHLIPLNESGADDTTGFVAVLDDASGVSSVEANGNLILAGAVPAVYDGAAVSELGFPVLPSISSIVNAGVGVMGAGPYSYIVVGEWFDAQGNVHRSLPSDPVSFTPGAANRSTTVTINTIRMTSKVLPLPLINLVAYRTASAGTVWYRAGTVLNSTTVATVALVDNSDDATLITGRQLYTSGGVLENVTLPACSHVCADDSRLFASGLEDPTAIWYSRELVQGEGVAFSDLNVISQREIGGDVVAVAMLDDKRIVFRERKLAAIVGRGPTDAGTQNDFSDPPIVISSPTGCNNRRSIVLTPLGLMFQGSRGIYLLDRSLQVSFIGQEVESTTAIIAAVYDEKQGHARFYTATGAFVFDLVRKQWSTFTVPNSAITDAVLWNGQFAVLAQDSHIYRELDAATPLDVAAAVPMTVESGWLHLAGVQGYQRVYELQILGQYGGKSSLALSIAYDYSDSYDYTATIDTTTITGATAGAGTSTKLQIRHQLRRQKCEALRFKLVDTPTVVGSDYAGVTKLTSFALLLGMKRGLFKPKDTQKVA